MASTSITTQCQCKNPSSIINDKNGNNHHNNSNNNAIGVLNPAFDDIEISELQFVNTSPLPYFTKLEPLTAESGTGLTYIQIDSNRVNSNNNSHHRTDDVNSLDIELSAATSCPHALTPTKLSHLTNTTTVKSKVRAYSLWFLLWCIIVVSFAGITASIACIVWLETYRELHTYRQPQFANLTDADSLIYTSTTLTANER